ncbi:MAG: radical SAM protein [Methylococcaceae bacterium]|nr:radical SAM protein [Methylococcaceae bacterium]
MKQKLTTINHDRDNVGLKYIYPVISRRAGGLSIGINVNINNACNWRCVYCQVPDLVRGAAPEMDFQLLERELRFFLRQVLEGDFFDKYNVSQSLRVIKDIAISGNGEPTSLKGFDRVIELVGKIALEMGVLPKSHFVLISNGSLINQLDVQASLKKLNNYQGEVWFKLDSATENGRRLINDSKLTTEKMMNNLRVSTRLCATSIQTCMMDYLDEDKAKREREAYIELLKSIKEESIAIKKIMLYTLARPSFQPEAGEIKKLDDKQMEKFANKIKKLDYFDVSVSL